MGLALNSSQKRISFWLAVTVLFFVACGGGSETPKLTGEIEQLSGQGVLTCSAQCSARGFCGPNAENQKYVLGNMAGPSTGYFDIAIPENTAVTINTVQNQTLQVRQSGEQIPMNFYLIALPDNTKAGWVAGWCLAAPSP